MEYQDINEEYQAILAEESRSDAWANYADYFSGIELDDDLDCFDEGEE